MSNCVRVHIDELVNGRAVNFPIHGKGGVLLLAAGATITSELKQRMKGRGIAHVIVNESDAGLITLRGSEEPDSDEKLTQRLDSILRSSGLGIKNTGPALVNQVKRHGSAKYDDQALEQLQDKQQETTDRVNEMMDVAAAGGTIDGEEVGDMASSCIDGLISDFDGAMKIVMEKQDNPSYSQHAVNLSMMAMAIAVELGLDSDNVKTVGTAGLVQDLGMSRVPAHIRDANRPLTAIEFLEIQKHPSHTLDILEELNGIPNIVHVIAYQSHERLDGTGYPRGRTGSSIHLFSRILHVADTYIAMTKDRPYRAAMMPYTAIECLLNQAKHQKLEPDVVRSLLHILSLFPIGSYLALSDGSSAQVIRSNGIDYMRPVVLLLQDKNGQKIDPESDSAVVDLVNSDLRVAQALPSPVRKVAATA